MLFYSLIACSPETVEAEFSTVSEDLKLVVYSGRGESMVGELLKKAELDLGIELEIQYGDTSELITRLLTEGDQTPADVIFAQDSGHLGALANREQLAQLSSSLLLDVDESFRDASGHWIGTSGRLRVLVYDSSVLTESELPKSLKELADPKWKGKLGWAPSNASFQAHISGLRHLWGEDETRTWLRDVANNEPKSYLKNSPQVKAADEGSLTLGWVNHYYLHRLNKDQTTAKNYSFPGKDAGNLMMLAGAAISKHSEQNKEAESLLRWLVSEETQLYFAKHNFEYPTRPGITLHEDVTPVPIERLSNIKQADLSDLGPTRKLLQELGLQ